MTELKLPELPYAKDALDPYMSAETLEFHHEKHHNGYAVNGTKLIKDHNLEGQSIEDIIIKAHDNADMQAITNNVGQFWNHVHFWNWMTPNGGGDKLPGSLEAAINGSFGSYDAFKDAFIAGGNGRFGSGWVWLVADDQDKLSITSTGNGENPIPSGNKTILGCDVWEHAYYIDYRNGRGNYLKAFVDNLVNWEYVEHLYNS